MTPFLLKSIGSGTAELQRSVVAFALKFVEHNGLCTLYVQRKSFKYVRLITLILYLTRLFQLSY